MGEIGKPGLPGVPGEPGPPAIAGFDALYCPCPRRSIGVDRPTTRTATVRRPTPPPYNRPEPFPSFAVSRPRPYTEPKDEYVYPRPNPYGSSQTADIYSQTPNVYGGPMGPYEQYIQPPTYRPYEGVRQNYANPYGKK